MPLHAVCPECEAEYNLPDEQEGLRVRCKKCKAVFTAEDMPLVEPQADRRAEVTDRPAPGPKAASGLTARPDVPRVAAEQPALGPAQHQSTLPWIVGGVVACVGLLAVGGIAVAIILKPASPPPSSHAATAPPPPVPMPDPYVPPTPTPTPPAPPPATAAPTPTPTPAPAAVTPEKAAAVTAPAVSGANEGRMTTEALAKVKKATVFIHVTFPDGRQVSGSGFFGAPENANIILTNAHVVGMLAPESRKPKEVEIVLNSGQPDMKKTQARVLGVDRHSDLAVLDVGVTDGMPKPLTVKPATSLHELDPVYIFGFPLGKSIGEEITVSNSTVSSLRKSKNSEGLDKVQVNGGMTHGNSGGPVVNAAGDVVGVAVSGYEGSQINFAIPGERVTAILKGRVSDFYLGLPITDGSKVTVPVKLEMIDPLKPSQIKSVGINVWTGNRGDSVPAGSKEPAVRQGDSPHQRVELQYSEGVAQGEVPLPELPRNKVYWLQPVYVTGTETCWEEGRSHDLKPELALTRQPATLRIKASGSTRGLSAEVKNSFRVNNDEDDDLKVIAGADFTERISSDGAGYAARLEFKRVKHELSVQRRKAPPPEMLGLVEANLARLSFVMRFDSHGNLRENGLDLAKLQSGPLARPGREGGGQVPAVTGRRGFVAALSEDNQAAIKQLATFLEPVQHTLEMDAIPLPNEDNCPPDKSWGATSDRPFPIISVNHYVEGRVRWTYTYIGQRVRNGKGEAVIGLEGVVHGKSELDSLGGLVTGTAVVDLASGMATSVETRSVVDVDFSTDSSKSARAVGTLVTKMTRE